MNRKKAKRAIDRCHRYGGYGVVVVAQYKHAYSNKKFVLRYSGCQIPLLRTWSMQRVVCVYLSLSVIIIDFLFFDKSDLLQSQNLGDEFQNRIPRIERRSK